MILAGMGASRPEGSKPRASGDDPHESVIEKSVQQ